MVEKYGFVNVGWDYCIGTKGDYVLYGWFNGGGLMTIFRVEHLRTQTK